MSKKQKPLNEFIQEKVDARAARIDKAKAARRAERKPKKEEDNVRSRVPDEKGPAPAQKGRERSEAQGRVEASKTHSSVLNRETPYRSAPSIARLSEGRPK